MITLRLRKANDEDFTRQHMDPKAEVIMIQTSAGRMVFQTLRRRMPSHPDAWTDLKPSEVAE